MNLLKANKLRSKADVWQRFLFRLFWGCMGGLVAYLIMKPPLEVLFYPGLAFAIVLALGVLVDFQKLRTHAE